MEKKVLFWAIGLVLALSLLFSLGGFTGYVTKTLTPVVTISNPIVKAGETLNVEVTNAQTSQEYRIYKEDGTYTGQRFFTQTSRCQRIKSSYYTCQLQYTTSPSLLPDGEYYIQAKNKRTGEPLGNKDYFTITGSAYIGR